MMKIKILIALLSISVLWNSGVIAYASELFQSFTPIQNLRVSNEAQFNGPADFNSTANFDGAATFNGATTLSAISADGDLDMQNNIISNIGAAGTDFGSDGSLTTAQTVTVTAGGLTVTAGGATITAGGLDMTNDAISNIGAAGTDFGSDGSLTTAQAITVSAGGLNVTGGVTVADTGLTVTAGGATVSSGGLTVSAGLTTLAGGLNHTPQEEVVTATFVITPSSGIILLTSSAEFTSSTSTPIITSTATHGDVITIANDNASDVIHIDGTGGTVECKADVALGAGDTLGLWYNGNDAVWNCLFNYDNS